MARYTLLRDLERLWTVGLTPTRGTAEILVHTLRAAARPRTARDVADPEPIRVGMTELPLVDVRERLDEYS